jgi:hypothetical protein
VRPERDHRAGTHCHQERDTTDENDRHVQHVAFWADDDTLDARTYGVEVSPRREDPARRPERRERPVIA